MSEPALTIAPAETPVDRIHRLTVEQYHQMIDAGILASGQPIELLEGLLITKMTRHPPHDASLMYTEEEVRALLTPEWLPRIQSAVTLPDSEPEPDVAVVAGPRRRYETHHPRPNEIAFLIEVADSTLADDRGFKGRLYARARIPIYWIVNLPGRQVEVYTRPRAGKTPHYRGCEVFGEGTNVPVVIGTTMLGSIPVKNLLPSA